MAVFRALLPFDLPVPDPALRLRFWDEGFAVALRTALTFLVAADFFPPGRAVRFRSVNFFLA